MKQAITLSEKLKNYSLLAGSVLASSVAAQGQVIYTDVDPDIELGGDVPSSYPQVEVQPIDLNNDGFYDFKITLGLYGTESQGLGFSFREIIDGEYDLGNNAIFTYSIDYIPWAFKMDCADSIPLFYAFYGLPYANFAFQAGAIVANNWGNTVDRAVGLKFNAGGSIHYGWLRLDVNTGTVPNIIIRDYAYDATPLKKIGVCDTGFAVGEGQLPEITNEVVIFPNPSAGRGVIKIRDTHSGNGTLAIKDMTGKEVYASAVLMQKEIPFDFTWLSPGLYTLELRAESFYMNKKWIRN